jgi:hypothetical protein
MRKKLGRLAAWLITGGLLLYVFWRVQAGQVAYAATHAAAWAIPVMVALTVVVYLADTFATWKTFAWFVAPLRFREVLTLRGATYLWALVNYALGQGAIVYFVKRSRGVPVARGAAAVLLIMGTNFLLLLALATVALALGGDGLPQLRLFVAAAYVGLAGYVALLVARPRFLASRAPFDLLFAAGIGGHLRAMAVRVPHVVVLVAFSYLGLRALGVEVPFVQAVLCLPAVYLVTAVPIPLQGFSLAPLAMSFFFARYAAGDPAQREAAVKLATAGSQAVAWCVQIVLGLICLRSELGQRLRDLPKEMSAAS